MMKRPEKLIVELVSDEPRAVDRLRGYNDAIDDYEAWLKEKFSVENLVKTMWSYYKEHNIIAEDRDILEGIAKSIIEEIGG